MLLVAAVAWIYFDGRSQVTVDLLREQLGLQSPRLETQTLTVHSRALAATTLVAVSVVAGMTLLGMFLGLFIGQRRFRTLRTWLLFTFLVCGWLGFVMTGPDIHWYGQQRRMAAVLAPVESMAQRLNATWPNEDGDLPEIGPYLAYPKGAPTLVLPLQWIHFPDTNLRFSAIERTTSGVIRFELTGSEAGAWLEWRADDHAPGPFKSGLETHYNVGRHARLAPHWFLVRYQLATGSY
jgi:hypothetical protein